MAARSSGLSVPVETKCQEGPGLAKTRPKPRPLTGAELRAIDRSLAPWALERAKAIRQAGVISSETRRELTGQVWLVLDPAPLTAIEQRRRRARRQGMLPWAKPVPGTEVADPRPREVRIREIWSTYEWISAVNPWHHGRSESLRRGLVAKLARCGTRELFCRCRRCGKGHEVPSRCDDRFCFDCSRAFYGRLRRRLVHASHAHMAAAGNRERHVRLVVDTCRHCGRQHPLHAVGRSRPQLWTLTVSHGESATETRDRITQGWVRLRAWLQKQLGRSLPFALVWEWTRGSGEHGAHVHAHVLVISPPLCWKRLSEEWQRATRIETGREVRFRTLKGGAVRVVRGARLFELVAGGVGHPSPRRDGQAHRNRRAGAATSATAAATYIAKYASKGSAVLEGEDADVSMLADVWRASYARRRVTASRGWWLRNTRVSPCCVARWSVQTSNQRPPPPEILMALEQRDNARARLRLVSGGRLPRGWLELLYPTGPDSIGLPFRVQSRDGVSRETLSRGA